MSVKRLKSYRRLTQAACLIFIFLVPILNILRYDIDSKELYILGSVWTLGLPSNTFTDMSAQGSAAVAIRFVLKAVLPWFLVLTVFPILGFFFGRFACGWLCPEGALFELTEFLTLKLIGRRNIYMKKINDPAIKLGNPFLYGLISILFLTTVPPITGTFLTGFFIAPSEIWREITQHQIGIGLYTGIIGVTIYMWITSIFVRHIFCRYVCAAGLMQTLFGWLSPYSLRIKFDRKNSSRCTDCKGCEKICFMDVKPRLPRKDINCVNCGECLVACERELGEGNNLFSFKFGKKE
jgi:polyferredoxin